MRPLACALFTSLASLSLLAGCLDGAADKGDEDDIPTDGKADSFGSPTEHGAIPFGSSSSAAFTDAEGFHSWTFTLTGTGGKVDLRTSYTTLNLDTVVYLYKKTGSTWGSYIATNDDASSSTSASRLARQLGAGEYRLIVKAYKRTQRGPFALVGACTGAGCPAPDVCEDAAPMPAPTGYTAACGGKLAAVFETGKLASTSYQEGVAYSTRCEGPSSVERTAMDHYAEYFAANRNEEDEELFYNIETSVLAGTTASGGGTIVVVDDGGDESSMRFVFDKDENLLAYYQDNQSPDLAFFCGAAGEAEIALPNAEDCVSGLTSTVVHAASAERTFNLTATPSNLPVGTTAGIATAFSRYRAANGTAASTKLTAAGKTWADASDSAGIFNLTAVGKPATRYVVERDLVLLEAQTGKPAALVCE